MNTQTLPAIALLEERPVDRIGERASVDVGEHDDAVHAQLALRPVELAQRRIGIVHRDRCEALETRGCRAASSAYASFTRRATSACRSGGAKYTFGVESDSDLDVDADAVHVLEALRGIGHRRRDAEEARPAVADDRATGRVGAERERAADVFDQTEERLRVVMGVQVPAHRAKGSRA